MAIEVVHTDDGGWYTESVPDMGPAQEEPDEPDCWHCLDHGCEDCTTPPPPRSLPAAHVAYDEDPPF